MEEHTFVACDPRLDLDFCGDLKTNKTKSKTGIYQNSFCCDWTLVEALLQSIIGFFGNTLY